ncbi:peptidoglycan recognition family protein [Streptomyces acidiscabies]|uniref:Peptidoglycan recognition family protein n=1 Tax=Streptomyces acidiscabies TaxID=42234 RepID=A0AAP6BHQ2_9ACTN|nr:peptidoglycan recognition family protein [Streptomyces acidiscabies]MBP5935257.1 N-acetylmuramoyl-L-alanine amidase [Streptomyces sp. LBUM 1476]MBZ3916910.1 N-acetylmuramoyl-L-alanine amidase [Streptomyces acidiscabies]MDX2964929.1 peptidoglycan recognition family protein [Streptomyces acidiscabies]MDX3024220.1 peptidoglycan recognition family protein [Streptomyces acidiscabies]MDX3793027.1 peptidoglycan recognition family protein [Streptomyces acidiscabies]
MGRSELSASGGAFLPGRRSVLLGALGAAATGVLAARPAFAAAAPGYTLRTRADWGADESLRFAADGTEKWPPGYYPLQTVSIHHTADGSTDPDPAARVRAIYREDAIGKKNFGDIGYHYLIDENGRVYEGRWSGTDGTPAHDARGRLVTAAHIGDYNSGNAGIALLGDLTSTPASPAARATLIRLLADLSTRHTLNPLATVRYRNPISGVTRTVPTISGHKDWAATLCPGTVHADLPAIRREVAALLDG